MIDIFFAFVLNYLSGLFTFFSDDSWFCWFSVTWFLFGTSEFCGFDENPEFCSSMFSESLARVVC